MERGFTDGAVREASAWTSLGCGMVPQVTVRTRALVSLPLTLLAAQHAIDNLPISSL